MLSLLVAKLAKRFGPYVTESSSVEMAAKRHKYRKNNGFEWAEARSKSE